MSGTAKKAILAVSFGTSYHETREKTIDRIENDIRAAYPEYPVYRAWTSKMIIRKIKKRDGLHIDNVKEAMAAMAADGITEVIVQPTHIINGIENDLMKEDVLSYRDRFERISFGTPLLSSEADNIAAIEAVAAEWDSLPAGEVLVLMGHGTTHYANSVYAALDYTFKDRGYENIFLGTVEAYPAMDSIMKLVKKYNPAKVHLAPFMIVAGDHATNDMAGDDEESWLSQFRSAGYEVDCHLKGLGEYKGIRDIFLHHLSESF